MNTLDLKKGEFESLVNLARNNWRDWRDVFEHKGRISDNVLLKCRYRFMRFCIEYSVHRTIRSGKHDELRKTLKNSTRFRSAIRDDSGCKLVMLERQLRRRFGTKNGKNAMISAFSKLAAFVRPDGFVAWDNSAREGVKLILRRRPKSYSDYLSQVDEIWNGDVGDDIRAQLKKMRPRIALLDGDVRFQRRVLDAYLMKLGGRPLLPKCTCCPIPEVSFIE
jgi:hypothetical protein